MVTRARWVKLVSRLNRLTQEGQISWIPIDPPESLTSSTSHEIPIFFTAHYNERDLGIFEDRYQTLDDYERLYWTSRIGLGLFDGGRQIWELPGDVSGIHELFAAVRSQSSGIDEFIESLGGEEENGDE